MMTDNALANFIFLRNVGGGDTGRRGAEHRGFLQLETTQPQETGQKVLTAKHYA